MLNYSLFSVVLCTPLNYVITAAKNGSIVVSSMHHHTFIVTNLCYFWTTCRYTVMHYIQWCKNYRGTLRRLLVSQALIISFTLWEHKNLKSIHTFVNSIQHLYYRIVPNFCSVKFLWKSSYSSKLKFHKIFWELPVYTHLNIHSK